PVGRRDVRDIVLDLKSRGVTVLLNSHLLSEVEQVCDDVAIIERGRVVREHALEALDADRLDLQLRIGGFSPELAATLERIAPTLTVRAQEPGDVVDLHGAVGSDYDVAAVAAAVIAGGGRLLRLTTDSESLEDLFLRVVGDDAAEVQA
ncbi:MAG: ABC-type multidrug transport system, ATPase component, partial [Thermoleophilia bacterium]|nr:ABC-type multidrug transport system, ATPase component [Thermoleophilia bacterium]